MKYRLLNLYTFLIILSFLPFLYIFKTEDNIYYNGWFFSSLLVALIPIKHINLKALIRFFFLIFLSWTISGFIDINILPITFVVGVFFATDFIKYLGIKKIECFLISNILWLSCIIGIKIISTYGSISHNYTYSLINFGSHRNLVMEYYVSLIAIYGLISENKKIVWLSHLFGFIFCFLIMSKSAILVVIFSLYNLFKKHLSKKKVRILFSAFFISFLIFNVYNYSIYRNNNNEYVKIVENRSDLLKQIDLLFQVNNGSANDRLKIWRQSFRSMSFRGNGLGSWKINSKIHNSGIITRRPHNEFLRYTSELGILLIIPLYLFRSYFFYLFIFSPLFIFSFPTERPEFLVLFFVLSFIKIKSTSSSKKILYIFKIFAIVLIFLLTRTAIIQKRLFDRDIEYSNLQHFDKKLVNLSKRDFLLNRVELFKILDKKNPFRNLEIKSILMSKDPEIYKLKDVFIKEFEKKK